MSGFNLALLAPLFFSLVLHSYGVEQHVISEEEDLELERQLKIIKKSALKTIQTEYSDIIDCVDIYKQPAFDHPLLKNHKIQRKPSFPSPVVKREALSRAKHVELFEIKGCPSESVPIRRTTKADLIRHKLWNTSTSTSPQTKEIPGAHRKASFPLQEVKKEALSGAKHVKLSKIEKCLSGSVPIRRTTKADLIRHKLLNTTSSSPETKGSPGPHFASLHVTNIESDIFYGGGSYINAYNPTVEDGQVSSAQMWIEAGPYDQINSVQVGWMVSPALYGDKHTHLFIYWTADGFKKTGCYNMLCPGFVQVDQRVTLGQALSNTSQVNGDQYVIWAYIYQDDKTRNWWLVYTDGEIHVGYWPRELVPELGAGATRIVYGGRAQARVNQRTPPMGSGLFPDGNYQHACYFENIIYAGKDRQIYDPTRVETFDDKPSCYGVDNHGWEKGMRYTFLFGGPGGDCVT